ncbi:uncharacterized protein LOC135206506 [Macrobrachium nipponense]|uniref:uncharacterized protein LOC135206506 n=1 Tax=Macrobrachium nipponense TaxID=159736 RepID=UPI0030C7D7F3
MFWFRGCSSLTHSYWNTTELFQKHRIPIDRIYFQFKVMGKEVEDIINDCIKPNFVELPEVIETLPTPNMRGRYQLDTDVEEDLSLTEERHNSQLKRFEDKTNKKKEITMEEADDVGELPSLDENSIESNDDVIYKMIPRQCEGGTYTWGFFLEGARWDREQHCLVEMAPKQLHDQLPIILFQPAVLPEGATLG